MNYIPFTPSSHDVMELYRSFVCSRGRNYWRKVKMYERELTQGLIDACNAKIAHLHARNEARARYKGDLSVEEIKERADFVELAQNYTVLLPRGRVFWGKCPFKSEKTPSFKIDPVKKLWYCFSCGEGSDMIGFIMKIQKLDFRNALEFLQAFI